MASKFTDEDSALLEELGVEVETKREGGRSAREERIIAGFEDIQRFVTQHGRTPQHGEGGDIFERLYAVRLDRLRAQEECRQVLTPLDHQGLLAAGVAEAAVSPDDLDDDALLAELGVTTEASPLTELRHVRSSAEKRAAEEIANREPCEDFATFKPLFDGVAEDLRTDVRETLQIRKKAGFLKTDIRQGEFFILNGQTLYVADVGEPIKAPNGESDARLRVIYSNGTESNILLRSLQRALYKDETSRLVSDPSSAGPLFSGETAEGDTASGTIYVLRSKSDHPSVATNREIIHKIGVTNMDVAQRISGAKLQPTYLMADVEVVATYELYNINRAKLENLIHRIFDRARLSIEIKDRFGTPVTRRERYIVPLFVIDEAVARIRDGTITGYVYDEKSAELVKQA